MHRRFLRSRLALRVRSIGPLILVLLLLPGAGTPPVAAQGNAPSVTIKSPAANQVVSGSSVPVSVSFKNWKVNCNLSGTPNKPGVGHWHVLLDGGLVDMVCGPAFQLSMLNLKPGKHTVEAVLAENDHAELEKSASKVAFTFEPAKPLPRVTDFHPTGKPGVTILSPKDGAAVSGSSFVLRFVVRNYRLSCDLMGKPKVATTGHWHVNVDTTQGPMMGMATMLNMGCTNSFRAPLAGIKAGKHRFIVLLTDNLHAPLKPPVEASVSVEVKK